MKYLFMRIIIHLSLTSMGIVGAWEQRWLLIDKLSVRMMAIKEHCHVGAGEGDTSINLISSEGWCDVRAVRDTKTLRTEQIALNLIAVSLSTTSKRCGSTKNVRLVFLENIIPRHEHRSYVNMILFITYAIFCSCVSRDCETIFMRFKDPSDAIKRE